MREIVLYLIAAIASLTVLGYSVHMFIGGLVSEQTENLITVGVVAVGAVIIAFMAYDVIKRRRGY